MIVKFQKRNLNLVLSDHAIARMEARNIDVEVVLEVLKSGKVKRKTEPNKYWVYRKISNRADNFICLSVVVEKPNLIVVTALINWSPES